MKEERNNGKGIVVTGERASIGKSIVLKGELSGGEDLTIEGTVEGRIELRDHVITIGLNGRIKAEVSAKSIVVFGQVVGNLTATEKVDLKEKGSIEGDIVAPRLAITDGAQFRGSVDVPRREETWNVDQAPLAMVSSRPDDLVHSVLSGSVRFRG